MSKKEPSKPCAEKFLIWLSGIAAFLDSCSLSDPSASRFSASLGCLLLVVLLLLPGLSENRLSLLFPRCCFCPRGRSPVEHDGVRDRVVF